jgi:hypothetical protein
MNANSLSLTNKKVIAFYQNNPSIDFEQTNILCVDLFETILQDTSNAINKSLTSQLLTETKETRDHIKNLSDQIVTINTNINKLSNEQTLRSIDLKKEYIDEIKNILNSNANEKLKGLLDNMNEQIIDKTRLIMHEFKSYSTEKIGQEIETSSNRIIDKTLLALNDYNKTTSSLVEQNTANLLEKTKTMIQNTIPADQITKFQQIITEDTRQIIEEFTKSTKPIENILVSYQQNFSSIDKDSSKLNEILLFAQNNKEERLKQFIDNFDSKYNILLNNLQQPILSVINSSEERIKNTITSLNETTTKQSITQSKVLSDLEEFLNKYRNSSFKGQLAENHLSFVLTKMFPTAEITDTSKSVSSCDFCLKRDNKDAILIENKDYQVNVDPKEVKKFINDCEVRNSHGIFLSQSTGITTKTNYQIDIHNGNILVYVHNCEYMASKIQIAIDIIDTLSSKIKTLNIGDKTNDEVSIPKEVLNEINEEYQKFIAQKESIQILVKEFQKSLLIKLEEIRLPKLENILPTTSSSLSSLKIIKCDNCEIFITDTTKKMSAHKRWCSKKRTNDQINV